MTQSIRNLISANLDRYQYLPPEQVGWRVVQEVDATDWRNVIAPLVVEAVRQARRARARATEELLDSMPAIDPIVQFLAEEVEQEPATALSAPKVDALAPAQPDYEIEQEPTTDHPDSRINASVPAQTPAPKTKPVSSPKTQASSGPHLHVVNRNMRKWVLEMRDVLESEFTDGDNKKVSWKLATVEQHQERIDNLSVLKAGVEKTIERHRKARDHCIANGVRCLLDLMEKDKEEAA